MGYLIPDEPSPQALMCLRVFIPNDPRYLEAFSGQYHDLGTWLLWDRDGTNRGALAAAAWKEAIDYTYENGWLNCGMDEISDILDRLEELENMVVNVNCGCGCGCSGGHGAGDLIQEINDPNTNLPITPLPGSEQGDALSNWKCDAANQLYADWYQLLSEMFAAANTGTFTVATIASIAGALAVLTGGISFALAILVTLAGNVAATAIDYARDWLDHHREDIICVIVSSGTPAAAYTNFIQFLEENKNTPTGVLAGGYIKNQLAAMAQDTNWNLLFTEGSMAIDSSNLGSSCGACGQAAGGDVVPILVGGCQLDSSMAWR